MAKKKATRRKVVAPAIPFEFREAVSRLLQVKPPAKAKRAGKKR